MRSTLLTAVLTAAISGSILALFSAPARADEGMWLFNRPPAKQLKEKHGFEIDAKWLENVQKSCVRLSTANVTNIK